MAVMSVFFFWVMDVIIHSIISLHKYERVLIVEEKAFKYYAFISYSHNDKKTAKKLQVWLEHSHLPSKVIESHPDLPKKLSPVFIDEADLVARDGSLTESLKGYLNESQYLILICSPSSAKSPYVNGEVDYFMNELGRGDRIIPLIVDGLPHAKDESIECFPPAILKLDREHEPLGIDLKTFKKRGAFLRVMATLLRLEIDYFISRAEEERKRRNIILSAVGAVLAVILGAVVWHDIKAFRVLKEAEVQSNLGFVYYVKKDYFKAAKSFENAIANGSVSARYSLGYMYEHGEGVEQDHAKARELYKEAEANDGVGAKFFLGVMYDEGQGVEQDYVKAIELYKKAEAQGHASAQYNLGYMYAHGEGVEQDYTKAVEWYEKAAAQGYADAQYNLGYMYAHGLGVEKDYAKARELYEKVAAQGLADAQANLGYMYENGLGVEQDYAKAREWYEKAAAQGNAMAQYNLSYIYANGLGVEQNYPKVKEWLEKAAIQGYASAQSDLGYMYENGLGVEKDYAKAREWYEKAAIQGHALAQGRLDRLMQKISADKTTN